MARRSTLSLIVATGAFMLAVARADHNMRAASRLGPGRPKDNARQFERVADRAKAKEAHDPSGVVANNWLGVLKQTGRKFSENELMSEAASVAFYALLSLVPALTAIVSLYGLFADPSIIEHQLDAVKGVVPSGGMQIITDQVHRLVQSPRGGLSVGAVVGILAAVWSANAATKAMMSALNDVYEVEETRNFFWLTLTSLALSLCGIGTVLLAIGAIVILPNLFDALGLHSVFALAVRILRVPVVLILLLFALAILFRYGPDRRPPRWRWVTWGGAFGAIGWIVLSIGFSWYVSKFGSYNKTYGSLGAVIGFMTWVWLSTTILLVGAQLNAVMEGQSGEPATGVRQRR